MSNLLTPLMTKTQLANELGIGEQTVKNYLNKYSDMPRPKKLGAKLYWNRKEIEEWVMTFLPRK